jgi:hypothetical protein
VRAGTCDATIAVWTLIDADETRIGQTNAYRDPALEDECYRICELLERTLK